MFDYIQRIRQITNKINELKIILPGAVKGWLLIRKPALMDEQKALVMSQVTNELNFDKVATVMQNTFGHLQVSDRRPGRNIHYQDEEWEQQEYDNDE